MNMRALIFIGNIGPVSERRLSENPEYINPEMRETLGFLLQNVRFVKLEKAGLLKTALVKDDQSNTSP